MGWVGAEENDLLTIKATHYWEQNGFIGRATYSLNLEYWQFWTVEMSCLVAYIISILDGITWWHSNFCTAHLSLGGGWWAPSSHSCNISLIRCKTKCYASLLGSLGNSIVQGNLHYFGEYISLGNWKGHVLVVEVLVHLYGLSVASEYNVVIPQRGLLKWFQMRYLRPMVWWGNYLITQGNRNGLVPPNTEQWWISISTIPFMYLQYSTFEFIHWCLMIYEKWVWRNCMTRWEGLFTVLTPLFLNG